MGLSSSKPKPDTKTKYWESVLKKDISDEDKARVQACIKSREAQFAYEKVRTHESEDPINANTKKRRDNATNAMRDLEKDCDDVIAEVIEKEKKTSDIRGGRKHIQNKKKKPRKTQQKTPKTKRI